MIIYLIYWQALCLW